MEDAHNALTSELPPLKHNTGCAILEIVWLI